MQEYTITESMRMRALLYFMGWQGDTIEQLARETALASIHLLNAPLVKDNPDGFSAVRTCDRDWRRGFLAPRRKGDWDFYSGVIKGFWVTGPLDGLNDRWPEHPVKTGLMRCAA